jgi:hypothetical protein
MGVGGINEDDDTFKFHSKKSINSNEKTHDNVDNIGGSFKSKNKMQGKKFQ